MAVLAPELPFSLAQNIFLFLLRIRVEDLIKNNQWKSVQIKWNGSGGGNGGHNGWDFALVKANGEGAQKFCESKGFNRSVSEDWVTVYQNLGWNVETKQVSVNGNGKTETKICI